MISSHVAVTSVDVDSINRAVQQLEALPFTQLEVFITKLRTECGHLQQAVDLNEDQGRRLAELKSMIAAYAVLEARHPALQRKVCPTRFKLQQYALLRDERFQLESRLMTQCHAHEKEHLKMRIKDISGFLAELTAELGGDVIATHMTAAVGTQAFRCPPACCS
eukprot:m.181045 g.181045  ORF g.181045 m.181045 type:complete len:164 (-) comp18027_c1_seq1:36-527(-)